MSDEKEVVLMLDKKEWMKEDVDFMFNQLKENWERNTPQSFFKTMQYMASIFRKLGREDISEWINNTLNIDSKEVREMLLFTLHYLSIGFWFKRDEEEWEDVIKKIRRVRRDHEQR